MFIACEPCGRGGDRLAMVCAVFRNCDDDLAPMGRRDTDHDHPGRQHALDLLRIDLVTPGFYHVVRAPREEESPMLVEIAEIAGRVERALGKFMQPLCIDVPDHHEWAAQMDFAVLVRPA